jgi:hypothetical protein
MTRHEPAFSGTTTAMMASGPTGPQAAGQHGDRRLGAVSLVPSGPGAGRREVDFRPCSLIDRAQPHGSANVLVFLSSTACVAWPSWRSIACRSLTCFTRGIGVTGYNLLAVVNVHHDRFPRWGSAWDGDLSRSAIHPRGLYLVRKLSSACGAQRGMECGLVAWFTIDVPRP